MSTHHFPPLPSSSSLPCAGLCLFFILVVQPWVGSQLMQLSTQDSLGNLFLHDCLLLSKINKVLMALFSLSCQDPLDLLADRAAASPLPGSVGQNSSAGKMFPFFFSLLTFYSQKKGEKKMGKVRVIGSWQGFYLGTAASIGKMPNTLTLLGAVCIFIASVAGCKINSELRRCLFPRIYPPLSRCLCIPRA